MSISRPIPCSPEGSRWITAKRETLEDMMNDDGSSDPFDCPLGLIPAIKTMVIDDDNDGGTIDEKLLALFSGSFGGVYGGEVEVGLTTSGGCFKRGLGSMSARSWQCPSTLESTEFCVRPDTPDFLLSSSWVPASFANDKPKSGLFCASKQPSRRLAKGPRVLDWPQKSVLINKVGNSLDGAFLSWEPPKFPGEGAEYCYPAPFCSP
ncbi:MAG: hypothetical protein J3Q66DRAFT_393565 [Benniella sp.]|nr:MAG: hypothetical protein J3Q66DRAFT_393565 [Benniella sp.]